MEKKSSESDLSSDEEIKLENHQEYIKDPHEYLAWCLKDKKIKVMDECNPIMPHVYLKDISLHKKGPLEDKIYSKFDKYYWNIRRGNTLCQIYDEQHKQKQLFMCRRGMKKFYDLEPEFLKINRKLTYKQERFRKRIFQKLDQTIGEGTKIHLYSLFKQNGQHCQISYLHKLGCWLFASKNVSILARNREDLQNNYHKQRFYWAKLIGQQFFKILQKFQLQKIKQFIHDIEGKTLLGEHCGYQQHQHITKYSQVQIIFYGLVQNQGNNHCYPVDVCQEFLQKYQLKMSKCVKVINLTNKHQVYQNMYKLLKTTAEGTMDEYGQGSVLYIVSENNITHIQQTIGMCKLKTCQYLIFRRIRQMIKIYFAKKGFTANNFEKYKFDIQNLCQSYFNPPKDLKYYYSIAKQAFKEIQKNGEDFTEQQFRYKFVNFLDNAKLKADLNEENKEENKEQNIRQNKKQIILLTLPLLSEDNTLINSFCKKYKIKIGHVFRQQKNQNLDNNVLNILHMVPRLNPQIVNKNTLFAIYLPEQQHTINIAKELENSKDISKSHLVSFIKSPDKIKSLRLLYDKISAFSRQQLQQDVPHASVSTINQLLSILNNEYNQKCIKQGDQQIRQNQKEQIEDNISQKIITVIATMALPGSGKTCIADKLIQVCGQKEINLKVISSDKIRQKVIQKFKSKNPGVSNEYAYANTKKQGLKAYKSAIQLQLEQHSEKKIIFIDRVFCPTTILQNLQELNREWVQFIVLTQTQGQVKLNDYSYPFSLHYLLTCLKRSLQRQGHETLSIKPVQIVKVVLKFYQMYRDYRFNKLTKQCKQQKIHLKVIGIDFVEQKQNEGTNLHLKRKVEQCLKNISPGNQPHPSQSYSELIEVMYTYIEHIQKKQSQQETSIAAQKMLTINCSKILGFLDYK